MKKIVIVFFICLIGFSLSFFLYPKPYFHCLDVEYNRSSMPITEITIQGKKYFATIGLGSKTPLSLSKKNLSTLRKTEKKERVEWKDFNGRTYFANSYLLSSIQLKNMVIKNIIVKENNDNNSINTTLTGTPDFTEQYIGRPVFEKYKILLNFKNNKVLISNDIKRLKDLGFEIASFIKVPCQRGRTGLIMEVETDLGKKRLSIDTGSTLTVLRNKDGIKNIDSKYKLPTIKSKKFQIQDKDFGPLDLFFINITPELHEMDGFLGMDFLRHHTIYIDFPNKVAYVSRE